MEEGQNQNSTISRNAAGKWLPGHTGNPKGTNGFKDGWQPFTQRCQKFFEMKAGDLAKYLENDGELLKQQSSIDAACIRFVINTISGKQCLAYLKEALDRYEGTSPQTIKHTGAADAPVIVKFTMDIAGNSHVSSGIPAPGSLSETE